MRLRVLCTAGLLCSVLITKGWARECAPNDPGLLKPDLVMQPPTKIRVVQKGGHRVLVFTTTVANLGDGPLIVHGQTVNGANGQVVLATQEIRRTDGTSCTHAAGTLEFAAIDQTFRLSDVADYQLRRDDPFTGAVISESKVALCLMDSTLVHGSTAPRQVFGSCSIANGTQGISVTYADVSDNSRPEQMFDLDVDPANPIPGGNYFLVNIADPDGLLLEKSAAAQADTAVVSVSVPDASGPHAPHQPGQTVSVPATPTPTPTIGSNRPPHAPHPVRPGRPTSVPTSTPPPTPTPTVSRSQPSPPPSPRLPHQVSHPQHPPHSLPPGHEGCGGIAGKTCGSGEFCQYLPGACNAPGLTGLCTPLNPVCSGTVQPVCGCNGVSYRNDCQRQRAGVSAAHLGPC